MAIQIRISKKLSKDIWERLPYKQLSKFLEYKVEFYTEWNPTFFNWINSELKEDYYMTRNNNSGILYMSSKEDFLKFTLRWIGNETKWK